MGRGNDSKKISRAEYMLERYHQRRDYAIEKLGGRCVICGSDKDLQLDHILREEKSFPIGQLWSVSWERYEAELDKCQLLCGSCHRAKTQWEVGRKAAIRTQGTLSSYRYCKCEICRKAYSDYWKKYTKQNPRKRAMPPAKAPGAR